MASLRSEPAKPEIKAIDAPYNFVPLADWVHCPDWAERVSHDLPFRDGICGHLDLTITAHTPLLVGGQQQKASDTAPGQVDPFKLPNGNYAIPGTSLKGMIRAIIEIASFSRMNLVDDQRLGVRDLTGGVPVYQKSMTETVSSQTYRAKSKAGWLSFDRNQGRWMIQPCLYARIEHHELERYHQTPWVIINNKLRPTAKEKYDAWMRPLKVTFDAGEDALHKHSPGCLQYRKASNLGQGNTEGTLVFTGQPSPKKHLEFIFYGAAGQSITVPEDVFRGFLDIHDQKTENSDPTAWTDWRDKPRVPVFYLEEPNKRGTVASLGLALMYKLAYRNSTHDAIRHSSQQHLDPENGDQVLWIESATAKERNWSPGALEVLRRHGMTAIIMLEVSDDPASLQQALAAHDLVKNGAHTVKLIANGGTKLQMLAASKALNGHLDELLYNSDRPCVLEHDRYGQPVQHVNYQRHELDLVDMLAFNNREIVPGTERCIWPTVQVPELPCYGANVEYTRDCHQRIAAWIEAHPDTPKKAFCYDKAAQLAPEQQDKFIVQIMKACAIDVDSGFKIRKDDVEALYNSAHKLDREAWSHVGSDEAPDIGRELEDAVAARVVHWLENNPEFAQIVQSVWCNVKVRRRGKKEDAAELDTALLLKNGILLHLECKSFDAKIKDMNSRLGELQRSSSQLARIAICAPSYPAFGRDSWYKKYDENVALMKQWKQFTFIEFTLPDQPGAEGMTFEQALEKWLKPYLPPTN